MKTKTHELKIWPGYFDQVASGVKRFEIRKNDRDFKVGDKLILKEWCDIEEIYTGSEVIVKVLHILKHSMLYHFGIEKDYCIMSMELI